MTAGMLLLIIGVCLFAVSGAIGAAFIVRHFTQAKRWRDDLEQCRVQLAGCSVAALGGGPKAERGDYGWSPAYQDVLDLREEVERLRVELAECRNEPDLLLDGFGVDSIEELYDGPADGAG